MNLRVLVVRLDNDGDVLLTGPALRAVAAEAGYVALLCGPRGQAAAELLPGIDEILCFRAPWIDPEPEPVEPAAVETLVEELRRRELDQAIVMTSFHQSALPSALVIRLASVRIVAAISEDYPGSLLDVRHRVPDDIHEVERGLSLVATLGYRLPADDDGRLAVLRDEEASAPEGPYVVLHPGASVPARAPSSQWSSEAVSALTAAGRRVVVTGGADERELTAQVAGIDAVDLGGQTTFAELASVLAQADCVVVGNTGPAHLAAAVGTPIVSLYAPVIPSVRWRPWRVPHILLGDQEAPCRSSRERNCPVKGHPCLDGISAEEVVRAVDSLSPLRKDVAA